MGPGPHFAIMPFGGEMGSTITGAPYSAVQTTEMVQKLADGNTIVNRHQSSIYRDKDGRVRIERALPDRAGSGTNQTPRTMIHIIDPVAGVSYMLQPSEMTAHRSTMRSPQSGDGSLPNRPPRPEGAGGRPPRGPQPQVENLGLQTINGVAATGVRTTQTIPVGAIGNTQPIQTVREVWTSQDLKIPVMIKTSDPRFGETTMQLTNISQTNPDASLFQVPSGYTVQTGPGRPSGGRRPPGSGSTR
jgi:hypothetical protein